MRIGYIDQSRSVSIYYICKSTVHTYISAKTTFSKKRAQNKKMNKTQRNGIAYTV